MSPARVNPTRWWNGDALRTRLFDGLSLLLPAGETFVIRAAQDWLAAHPAADARLREQALRFVREEQAHQRVHRQYNLALASAVPVALQLEQRIAHSVRQLDGLGLARRLALAEAFEHLTALLSAQVLRGTTWVIDDGSRESRMWRWHCAEELAHRHVAAELLRVVRPAPGLRGLALVLATAYIAGDVLGLTWALCRHDVQRGGLRPAALFAQAAGLVGRATPDLLRMTLGWCGHLVPLMPQPPRHRPA
jgi:predicted metal-dependent hydrolase